MINQTLKKPTINLPYPLKVWYRQPLVFKGTLRKLDFIDKKGFIQCITIEDDDMVIIIDAEGTTLFAFPRRHMKLKKDKLPEQTQEYFFNSYGRRLNIAPPGEALVTAGHVDSIIYISDNVMYPGDTKEREQLYHHFFDDGKKPVFKYGDGYIISNLKMPAGCIKTKDLNQNIIPENAININNGANS